MDSSFDISFDTTALLDDHQLDTRDLLENNGDILVASPIKKPGMCQLSPFQSLSSTCLPELPCSLQSPSNELFQVTHHLRQKGDGQKNKLKNDKIHKLLSSLKSENNDFQLDDQLRSHVFMPRAPGKESYNNTSLDPFDLHLDAFLQNSDFPKRRMQCSLSSVSEAKNSSFENDNKENVENAFESSKRKMNNGFKKKSFKKSRSYASIPLSQSTNLQNYAFPALALSDKSPSPKRICVPKTVTTPSKPSIKMQHNLKIFLVDSSTSSIEDATSFGTELNSSNCEGFPLPETFNEAVQIPTNEKIGSAARPRKAAIIRASAGKRFSFPGIKSSASVSVGFYSKREFEEQIMKKPRQVTVFQDSQKHVRWADELEW